MLPTNQYQLFDEFRNAIEIEFSKAHFNTLNSSRKWYIKEMNMAMNKNAVLAWATWVMIFVGVGLIALGAFKYEEVAGYGFAAVGFGFFAIAWVFNALKGRV